MIRHSVILKLKSTLTFEQKTSFFAAVEALRNIPDVRQFEVLNQVNSKNKFEYGISMEFDTNEQFDAYTTHPYHVAFVSDFWIPNVEDFLEIDYTLYEPK